MTDEAKARCNICKRPLDSPSDPTSLDCGGDCLRCMALVAEDPDCMKSYIKTQAREIERLTLTVRKLQGNQAALEAELAKFKALAETLAFMLEAGTRFMPSSATVWHREAAKALRQYKEATNV